MSRFIIVGKAASGKDWLLNKMKEKGYVPMRQYTTRLMRENESGNEYVFLNDEEYDTMVKSNMFISSNFYTIGWYGVTLEDFLLSSVSILSPANVVDIFTNYPFLRNEFTIVYLDIPVELRRERLASRYTGRVDDDNERRIASDENDFKDFTTYDIRLKDVNEIENFINTLSPYVEESINF